MPAGGRRSSAEGGSEGAGGSMEFCSEAREPKTRRRARDGEEHHLVRGARLEIAETGVLRVHSDQLALCNTG